MSDHDFKISVILPVYGGEIYLEQCLDSVLRQTYSNLEIIIVNDGSPDSCPIIIDRYAALDERVIAIHKNNAGYGSAINSGLDIATGDFISIIETDDWVQIDMFERLISAYVKKTNPIVKATFNRVKNESIIDTQFLNHLCEFDSENLAEISPVESIELFLLESSIWTAIYRRDFLESYNIRFYESPGASYQDMPFKFIIYSIVDKITLLNVPVYNYRVMNQGSSSASPDKALISFNNYDLIKSFLLSSGKFNIFLSHFYYHHMFDLVFHTSRLQGEGLKLYLDKAKKVFDEGFIEGFNPNIDGTNFSPDTNHYYHHDVLPIYNKLMANKKIARLRLNIKLKKFMVERLRMIISKLIIEPISSSIFSKIDTFLYSVKIDDRLEIIKKSLKGNQFELSRNNDKLEILKELIESQKSSLVSYHSSVLELKVAPTDQFYYYMRTNENRISNLRTEFRKGLDEFSLLNEKKLFGFYEILPYFEHQGLNLLLPLSLNLFTDEDRLVLLNYDKIIEQEESHYQHLDLTELPVTLATNYFKAGLKYVPNGLTANLNGKTAIDCGAWVGDTAIMFASFGFEKIIAIEPMLDNYECMLRNIERNKIHLDNVIEPLNVAVGDSEGQLSMLKVGNDGVGSCVVDQISSDSIRVPSVTIDNLVVLADYPAVGLIKFDIEGYELNALKGAESTIRKHKPILLISVYHLWLQPEQIFDCKKFVENLRLGYKFKFVHLQPERDLIYEYMLVCW